MDITIKINDKDVQNPLKTLRSRVQYMQPIMRQIAEFIYGKKDNKITCGSSCRVPRFLGGPR